MAGLVRGGGETFDLEISRALEALGCEVTFLIGAPMFGRARLPIKHPRVHYLHTPYLPWLPWDKIRGGWRVRQWEFQWFEQRAAAWIQRNRELFDVIQVCELPYLVSRSKGERGEAVKGFKGEREKGRGGNKKSKIVLRLTAPNAYDPWGGIQLADAVIASGTSIEKIRKTIRPDVVEVPNGVDLKKFGSRILSAGGGPAFGGDFSVGEKKKGERAKGRKDEESSDEQIRKIPESESVFFRERDGIPSFSPILLYVARFQAFKNHKLLIEAFSKVLREVPEARLILAGSGPLLKETMEAVAKSGIAESVRFLGEILHADLPAVNQAATLAVISSEYESFCFTAIEAMACGLPVVTTDCGWVPKLIGDEREPVQYQWTDEREDPGRYADLPEGGKIRSVPGGLVVMRGDATSLAMAMVRMIRDAGFRDACGIWNRAKAEREHGWESSARRLLGVYERLVGEEVRR